MTDPEPRTTARRRCIAQLWEPASLHAACAQAHFEAGADIKKVLPPHQLETYNTMKNKELVLTLQREQGLGFFAFRE